MEHHADKVQVAMAVDPSDGFRWTGWQRRYWPAAFIRPRQRFYAFDKKSRHFTAVLEITKGRSFSYTTKADFARKVKDATGTWPDRKDAHWDGIPESQPGRPCTGIALHWKMVEEVDILFRDRFPQLGWYKPSKDVPVEWPDDLEEGGNRLRRHVLIEQRSKRARLAALEYWRTRDGVIRCRVCEFDFELQYGPLGRGFIEMHHERPLSRASRSRKVGPGDLKPLCANCHRMIHRLMDRQPNRRITVAALRAMLR